MIFDLAVWFVRRRPGGLEMPIRDAAVVRVYRDLGWEVCRRLIDPHPLSGSEPRFRSSSWPDRSAG